MKSIPIIRDRLFSIFKHRLKDPSFQRLKLTERTTEVVSVLQNSSSRCWNKRSDGIKMFRVS